MEYVIKTIKTVLWLVLFVGFIYLIILGQRSIGYNGLGMMMLGLAGILFCMWAYNKRNR